MTEQEEKISKLENLLELITQSERDYNSFDNLYKKTQEEYFAENNEYGSISYRKNLKQTIEKKAKSFILAKRKWKSANKLDRPFSDFINNFKQDVNGELTRLRLKNIPDTTIK